MGSASSKPAPTPNRNMTAQLNEKAANGSNDKATHANGKMKSHKTAAYADSDEGDAVAELDPALVDKWDSALEKDTRYKLARLILSNNDPVGTLKSFPAVVANEKVFNVNLKGVGKDKEGTYPGPRVNQASSGRCWLFATTNVLRYNVVEVLGLDEFELSQNYLFFYDKLEKANYYLETVLALKDEPLDGRLMSFLNVAPVNDGGQWDMAYNLVEKYGVVPKTIYPDAFSASSSSKMGWLLTAKLREYALELRKAAAATDASPDTLRKQKSKYLSEIYATLCINLGTPPKPDAAFTWDYYDKENKYHSWKGTPREFYSKFAVRKNMDPKDSFSLINDPRNEYEKLYTVKHLGNVWGGPAVRYVNAPIEALEDAVIAGIKANTPLFYGCDVGKFSEGKRGIMDTALFDIEAAYGYSLGMDKAQRLITGESAATHAMVITAVHVDEKGRPVRYKVENSWSDTSGDKGWWMMSAEWFREYVYQVVVPRGTVEKKWVDVLKQTPRELEPWDPMGALA